jgi:hypothetical protein
VTNLPFFWRELHKTGKARTFDFPKNDEEDDEALKNVRVV